MLVNNAFAQLATVNAIRGRIFNNSDGENAANETNMRDTRSLIDTRRYQTNKSHFDSDYRAQQLYSNTDTCSINNYHSEMINDQIARYFCVEGQLRYYWGADQENMAIINRNDKSPETSKLVTRRIELAKPGAMRPHWNKNHLGREICVPKQPEENETREIKRIDLQLKRKESESHIGGGYFGDFGDEKPQRTTQDGETHRENETQRNAESTTSNNSKEKVATHEPGAYPAIPVQDYRDGPIEEIAVHYVRTNCIVEEKAKRNKQQEDNVRLVELDFILTWKGSSKRQQPIQNSSN